MHLSPLRMTNLGAEIHMTHSIPVNAFDCRTEAPPMAAVIRDLLDQGSSTSPLPLLCLNLNSSLLLATLLLERWAVCSVMRE